MESRVQPELEWLELRIRLLEASIAREEIEFSALCRLQQSTVEEAAGKAFCQPCSRKARDGGQYTFAIPHPGDTIEVFVAPQGNDVALPVQRAICIKWYEHENGNGMMYPELEGQVSDWAEAATPSSPVLRPASREPSPDDLQTMAPDFLKRMCGPELSRIKTARGFLDLSVREAGSRAGIGCTWIPSGIEAILDTGKLRGTRTSDKVFVWNSQSTGPCGCFDKEQYATHQDKA
ncbi:hypothetical protein WJX84_003244 [Apatococcus fuscideae]|uniref:Uncharacterized protein n=1 Tax=Apatococcus fuscideae TaxID=2026836 RepID=A0AAW1T8R6_9CHLO